MNLMHASRGTIRTRAIPSQHADFAAIATGSNRESSESLTLSIRREDSRQPFGAPAMSNSAKCARPGAPNVHIQGVDA